MFEMMPFRVFCTFLYYIKGSRAASRCQKCTRFFVKDESFGNMLKKEFTKIYLNDINFLKFLLDLIKTDSLSFHYLDLYYLAVCFLKVTYQDNFFIAFCFESCNKPSQLYALYLKTILNIFFVN